MESSEHWRSFGNGRANVNVKDPGATCRVNIGFYSVNESLFMLCEYEYVHICTYRERQRERERACKVHVHVYEYINK